MPFMLIGIWWNLMFFFQQGSKEVELPPNEQHERVNLILMASALLLLFNVMVFLIYLSTIINNGKIMLQKSWTTEKWVTKGNNFVRWGSHVHVGWKNYARQEKVLRKYSFSLRRNALLTLHCRYVQFLIVSTFHCCTFYINYLLQSNVEFTVKKL